MNVSRRILYFLLGLSLFMLAATGSEVYSRLTYLWAFLLIVNWVWAQFSLRGVRVVRRPRLRRGYLGQVFEERFQVFNLGLIPRLWLEIRDYSNLPGSRGSHVVSMVGGKQRRTYLARTRLVQRGLFQLGPTVVSSGDPFGLFQKELTLPAQDALLVYPYMVDVHDFPDPPGLLTGGEALRRRTHYVTANAAGVREYAPGDSLSRMHWPTTARRRKLMVKEFELDPQGDVWLFIDAEQSVHVSQPSQPLENNSVDMFLRNGKAMVVVPPATEEYAASIAASLGQYFLRKRRAVGLVNSGTAYTVIPPDRGGRQLGKLLEALALYNADGSMSFPAMVNAQAQHITRGSTVLLITPSVHEKVALTVDLLQRRGLRPIVCLLDASSFGGNGGSDRLALQIASMGVPTRLVKNGALEEGLAIPVSG